MRWSVQFICLAVSKSLWPHGPQHSRPPCPSPTPGAYSNSCPLSRWCHPTISSSVVPFSSCLQSFFMWGDRHVNYLVGGILSWCSYMLSRISHVWLFVTPGSSVHGISLARILEWVDILSSRGSSRPRGGTHMSQVSCIGKWVLYH